MDENTMKWLLLREIETTIAVYPREWTDRNKIVHKRTDWQEGWNACVMYRGNAMETAQKFVSNIMERTREKLMRLLRNRIVFMEVDCSDKEAPKVSICVNCNDIFYYSCSDAEEIPPEQLESFCDLCVDDKGVEIPFAEVVWCAKKRNMKPIPEIIRDMKLAGVWKDELEGLGEKKNG